MQVRTASRGGHAGRRNEDFVGHAGNAVVLLDGAGIPGTEHLCHHGTAWYAETLGRTLLEHLADEPGGDLRTVLAAAITSVTDRHRGTCDVRDVSSPQATVAVLRVDGGRADHLVLGDCTILTGTPNGMPTVVTDSREVLLRRSLDPLLEGRAPDSPEHTRALRTYVARLREERNRPGGYWLAKDDPGAADEALLGSFDVGAGTTTVLLSNGAGRLVDRYGVLSWSQLLLRCRQDGPDAVLDLLRAHEARADPHGDDTDDATVAVVTHVDRDVPGEH